MWTPNVSTKRTVSSWTILWKNTINKRQRERIFLWIVTTQEEKHRILFQTGNNLEQVREATLSFFVKSQKKLFRLVHGKRTNTVLHIDSNTPPFKISKIWKMWKDDNSSVTVLKTFYKWHLSVSLQKQIWYGEFWKIPVFNIVVLFSIYIETPLFIFCIMYFFMFL